MATLSQELKLNLGEIVDDTSLQLKESEMPAIQIREFANHSIIKQRSPNIKQLLIPRQSLDFINYASKRMQKSPFSNPRLSLNPNTLDQVVKIYLKKEEKANSEMRFLKKHFSSCVFFQNYAIPLGDDVFEQCLQKLKIQECSQNSYLINKGDQINNLYILISGSAIKSRFKVTKVDDAHSDFDVFSPQKQKSFSIHHQQQQQQQSIQSPLSPQFPYQMFTYQNSQCSSPSSVTSEQIRLYPISSILESQFVQRSESSSSFIFNSEDNIYAYLTSSDFVECIQNSKNSELIQSLNELRQSQFLSDWSMVKLKPIISQSTVVSFQRHQYVYKQGDPSSSWYLILDGEFEYEKEILIENEISDIVKACLDSQTHEFKKQTIITDENQKGKTMMRVSILQKGEIFGIEDLIPKQDRRCFVKCLSNVGSVRKINEQYITKLLSRNNDEGKKLTSLAEQKNTWLEMAIQEKLLVNQQIHNTILDSKRNRTIQMIKKKEESNSLELRKKSRSSAMNIPALNTAQNSLNNGQNNGTTEAQRDLLGLADTPEIKQEHRKSISIHHFNAPSSTFQTQHFYHQKNTNSIDAYFLDQQSVKSARVHQIKTPINLVQPEKAVTFIKRVTEGDDKLKIQLNKEVSQERKSMIEAKGDLLQQYRVSINKYFSENNQKLYKKVEKKKLGVDLYLNSRKENGDSSVHNRSSRVESDSSFPLKQINVQGEEDEKVKSADNSQLGTSRHAQRVLSEYTTKTTQSTLTQINTKPPAINPITLLSGTKPKAPTIPQNRFSLIQVPTTKNLVSPTRTFSQNLAMDQAYNSFYANLIKKNNDIQQGEQNSPLLSFTKKLYLPSNTKKMLFSSYQQNTPTSSTIEKYNISTQTSSFFKKGNERLEQIISARNQQMASKNNSNIIKIMSENSDSFQFNKSPQRQIIRNDLQLIKDIKQKINHSQKRSSSTNS